MKIRFAELASLPVVPLPLTRHARLRLTERRLDEAALGIVQLYGRAVRVRGAEIFVIGRREVARHRPLGVDLRPYEGVQVVCSPDGHVLTAYRNHDLSRLRPRRRRAGRRHGAGRGAL